MNLWGKARQMVFVLVLALYVGLGVQTFSQTLARPIGPKFMEDFDIFIRAYQNAVEGNNPYANRNSGTDFLYPPPSLFVFGSLGIIASPDLRAGVFIALNLVALGVMLCGVGMRYGYSIRKIWWWFPLAFGFAPFLELLFVGQINLITVFGIFLAFYFADTLPVFSGAGLWLSIVTKVTPVAFLGYLFIVRAWRSFAWSIAILGASFIVSSLVFGVNSTTNFIVVLNSLKGVFYGQFDSQALVSIFVAHGWLEQGAWVPLQDALDYYIAAVSAVSAVLAWQSRRFEPFFIVLSFGVAMLPNNLWYNRHVFLLLPIFVWCASSRLDLRVVVWCVGGLFIIQLDRYLPTYGLMIHLFAHASIAAILTHQFLEAAQAFAHFTRVLGAALLIVLVLIVAIPLASSLSQSLTLRDAREWIGSNLPDGSRIALGEGTPAINDERFVVETFSNLAAHPSDWYEQNGFEYVVVGNKSVATFFNRWRLLAQSQHGSAGIRIYQTKLVTLPTQRVARRFGIFADWLELVGYDLKIPRVEFFWRVVQSRHDRVQQSVRLLNRAGELVDQVDTDLFVSGEQWPQGIFTSTIQFSSMHLIGLYKMDISLEGNVSGAIPVRPKAQVQETERLTVVIKIPPSPPTFAELDNALPLDAKFENNVSLARYGLSNFVRTEPLRVRLYWRTEKPITNDFTIFVHLLNQHGNLVAQVDASPLGGLYPISIWEPGEIIMDEMTLDIPSNLPSGEYSIIVGMYESPSLIRSRVLRATGEPADDHVLLATVVLN